MIGKHLESIVQNIEIEKILEKGSVLNNRKQVARLYDAITSAIALGDILNQLAEKYPKKNRIVCEHFLN
ncbi:hypothetical protein BZL35_00021 [Candidatus Pandoraea novymonadis]|uniref:Uncharacterized protein n=1 Tax=Candidatus Pandoraea novymonadis TaxID=1808959 RepID=A0ABX5FDI0_9BURK|nr:hypothetical protein BZL35_00021 [Candidatus Pandoraea novymonadis]